MTKEREIELLMMDNCTKFDAEKHLKKWGYNIWRFWRKYRKISWRVECWWERKRRISKKMVTDKIPVEDWGIVEDNGNTYYIMYVL